MDIQQQKIAACIQHWLEGYSKNTYTSYSKTVTEFVNFIGSFEDLQSCDKRQVQDYLVYLKPNQGRGRPATSVSKSTQVQRLSCLKALFKALMSEKLLNSDPTAEVKIQEAESDKKESDLEDYSVFDGFKKIQALEDRILKTRNHLIALLLATHALKRSEITNLRIEDIIAEGLIVRSGSKSRLVPLQDATQLALKQWLKLREKRSPWLFMGYARKSLSEQKLSDFAIRDLTMKYFNCSPQQLRSYSITRVWQNSEHNDFMAHLHSGNKSKQGTMRKIKKVYIQHLPNF